MKFLGSLFVFAIISACAVFGAPTPDINQYDDTFHYWISTDNKKATIMGVNNKYANTVVVKPYITVQGERYYIHQIGAGAFSNTYVQNIVINSDVQSMHFSPNAFINASYIRTIELKTEKVTSDVSAFDGCGNYLGFSGVGTASLANDLAKQLLERWGLPVNKDYTNLSDYERNKALFELAKKVKNFSYATNIAYPDNVAVVLALKTGGSNGIARAFRILALNMGFKYNDVNVGGDGGYYSWNLVHTDIGNGKKWYNLDIIHTTFPSYYTASVFKTDSAQSSITNVSPSNWIIYINQYNFLGEQTYSPNTEKFYDWLVRNRQGVRAN